MSSDEDVMQQAQRWKARLESGEVSAADQAAFADWLRSDDAHAHAYEDVESVWALIDAAAPAAAREQAARRSASWWKMPIAAAAAVLAVALLISRSWLLSPEAQPPKSYAAGIGEVREVELTDGSKVVLNTRSSITVRFSASERRLMLAGGEIFATVARDATRPFVVDCDGGVQVKAVGTRFGISSIAAQIRVTVSEGVVEVAQGSAASKRQDGTRVSAGHMVHYSPMLGLSAVEVIDPDAALAWLHSTLVYRNADLATVVRDLNRYFVTPVEIADADAGHIKVSGVFVVREQKQLLKDLQLILPIEVQEDQGALRLRTRPSQRPPG